MRIHHRPQRGNGPPSSFLTYLARGEKVDRRELARRFWQDSSTGIDPDQDERDFKQLFPQLPLPARDTRPDRPGPQPWNNAIAPSFKEQLTKVFGLPSESSIQGDKLLALVRQAVEEILRDELPEAVAFLVHQARKEVA